MVSSNVELDRAYVLERPVSPGHHTWVLPPRQRHHSHKGEAFGHANGFCIFLWSLPFPFRDRAGKLSVPYAMNPKPDEIKQAQPPTPSNILNGCLVRNRGNGLRSVLLDGDRPLFPGEGW